ncbi:AAA family ATPase [Mycoplasma sp. 1012]
MKEFEVKVERKIFENNTKNFFIFLVKTKEKQIISLTSKINLELKKSYLITALEKNHPKYQNSWELKKCELIIETNEKEIVKYFSSSLFPGIGQKMAQSIYNTWGDKSIFILKNDPNLIYSIPKLIPERKAKIIFDKISTNSLKQEIEIFFFSNGLENLYSKLDKKYRLLEFWKYLKEQPFCILDTVDEYVFADVDKMALALGIKPESKIRKKYIILNEFLTYLKDNENTFLEPEEIKHVYKNANKKIFMSIEEFKEYVKILMDQKFLFFVKDKKNITHFIMYEQEQFIAKTINEIKKKEYKFKYKKSIIGKYLDDIQKNSVISAFENNLTIITGGPGTGKTEILKFIYKGFSDVFGEKNVAVLTPTGRASFHILQKASIPSRTIHSFLEVSWENENIEYNLELTKEINALIIDEFSMVNTDLFYKLLKSLDLNKIKKIVLIGDKDQLPSIGYGNLLNNFINSDKFITNKLINNYRQKDKQEILEIAASVNNGQIPVFKNNYVKFYESNTKSFLEIFNKQIDLFLSKFSINDFIVIAPKYAGNAGINNINKIIQSKIFDEKNNTFFEIDGIKYFVNDKVMQTENDSSQNLVNGEIGYIENILFYKEKVEFIIIKFNDKLIKFTEQKFRNSIVLSYCVSVHKFQGSETSALIYLIFKEYNIFLNKKIFYTGITRAKDELIIIGEKDAIGIAVSTEERERKTNINYFLEQND